MKRWVLPLLAFLFVAPVVQAQYIWIIPERLYGPAKVIYSENLQPDRPERLAKINQTRLRVRASDGKESRLTWTKADDGYQLEVPGEGIRTVVGICDHGVVDRERRIYLQHSYAKLILGNTDQGEISKPWNILTLEIAPTVKKNTLELLVLFKGKPVPNTEVFVYAPGTEETQKFTTKTDGIARFTFDTPGVWGFRVTHIEPTPGEQDGMKYRDVRHFSTLVMDVATGRVNAIEAPPRFLALADPKAEAKVEAKADPAATKLLAEARAARADWAGFPGFTADAEINFDGKVQRGKVRVDAAGTVTFEEFDKDLEAWARRQLASTVSHRLDNSADRNTPCAFADNDEKHPLGRAIRVLNDELHSDYRIRDKEITVVHRVMKDREFVITVLENTTNADGRFLPAHYTVTYWDRNNGQLQNNEAHSQTWTRVGKYDLPRTLRVVTTSPAKLNELPSHHPAVSKDSFATKVLTLSNHKLLEATGR